MGDIELIETIQKKFNKPIAIVGFPDVGLVGSIAVSHMIETLGLGEIAHIESEELPPIVVVRENRPRSLIRVYGNESIICVVSETPLPSHLIKPIANTILEWLKNKDVSFVVSIGGIAHPERMEIERPNVYAVPSTAECEKILKDKRVPMFQEGFLVGPNGVVVLLGKRKGIPSIHLMSEAYLQFPDPGAAAATIEVINRLFGLKVNIDKLLEKEEEIRLKTKELMRRTQEMLKEMKEKSETSTVMYR